MKNFLMCYPQNFLVNYEINDWMKNKTGTVDTANALSQWKELYKNLLSIGNKIELIKEQPIDLPDLVFTANAAIKCDNRALISHFSNKERQPESLIYQQAFEGINYKTDMSCIEQNISFEGESCRILNNS